MPDLSIAPIRCYSQWRPPSDDLRTGGGVTLPRAMYQRIAGTVSKLGTPGPYRVRLHLRRNGVLYAQTWSNAAGDYVFEIVPPEPCYVVAFDDSDTPVNAAISDYVMPVPMP